MAERIRHLLGEVFHEFPLVLFSSFASVACGLGTGWWAVIAERGWTAAPAADLAGIAALVMAAALLFSLLHLGRPLRMARALVGFQTSYLSWEIGFAVGFLFLAVGSWLLLPSDAGSWTWLAACCCSLAFFAALGQVYRLRGQLTWGYRTSLPTLLLGTASGLIIIQLALPEVDMLSLAALLLGIDIVLLLTRWRGYAEAARTGRPDHPVLFAARTWILVTRGVLADLMPLLYLLAPGGDPLTAGSFLFFGLLSDRTAFYGLSVRRSTRSEMARVEHIIRHQSP